jgi:hypothetical protein
MKTPDKNLLRLTRRIEALEDQNRSFRRISIVMILFAITLLFLGAANSSETNLTTESLTLVDKGGKTIALLSAGEQGQAVLSILGKDGKPRLEISGSGIRLRDELNRIMNLGLDDWGDLLVKNPEGYDERLFGLSVVDQKGFGRLGLGIYSDNSTSFFCVDPSGQFRIGLGVDKDSYTKLKLYDRFGNKFLEESKE